MFIRFGPRFRVKISVFPVPIFMFAYDREFSPLPAPDEASCRLKRLFLVLRLAYPVAATMCPRWDVNDGKSRWFENICGVSGYTVC